VGEGVDSGREERAKMFFSVWKPSESASKGKGNLIGKKCWVLYHDSCPRSQQKGLRKKYEKQNRKTFLPINRPFHEKRRESVGCKY